MERHDARLVRFTEGKSDLFYLKDKYNKVWRKEERDRRDRQKGGTGQAGDVRWLRRYADGTLDYNKKKTKKDRNAIPLRGSSRSLATAPPISSLCLCLTEERSKFLMSGIKRGHFLFYNMPKAQRRLSGM